MRHRSLIAKLISIFVIDHQSYQRSPAASAVVMYDECQNIAWGWGYRSLGRPYQSRCSSYDTHPIYLFLFFSSDVNKLYGSFPLTSGRQLVAVPGSSVDRCAPSIPSLHVCGLFKVRSRLDTRQSQLSGPPAHPSVRLSVRPVRLYSHDVNSHIAQLVQCRLA